MTAEDRGKKVAQKALETFRKLAVTQAPLTIGQTAVAMHEEGLAISKESLIERLIGIAQSHQPGHLEQVQYEAAARLLGWHPEPEGG